MRLVSLCTNSSFGLVLALGTLGCTAPSAEGTKATAPSVEPSVPSWCGALDEALTLPGGEQRLECLQVPNFLLTGFFGTRDNPERSDFAKACLADSEAVERLRIAIRPAADFRFSYEFKRDIEAGGELSLGFLGPWAPRLQAKRSDATSARVTVELADAEIRVLSSVAEVLGQLYQARDRTQDIGPALEACLSQLCDDGPVESELVYTAKVLADVPVITVRLDTRAENAGAVSILGNAAGFELKQKDERSGTFELRGKEKLNVAALREDARAAFEGAGTCRLLRESRLRRKVVDAVRDLGVQVLAGRNLNDVPENATALRADIGTIPEAFSVHERQDLSKCLEGIEAASRELAAPKPSRRVCAARDLFAAVLTGNGADNQLHELLQGVAEPLHRRLLEVANEHALPCAEPAFYRDADGDGYGDPSTLVRATKQPNGFVANSLDCYDNNPEARPGQTKYLDRSRGDGSFDYDCDGRETPRKEAAAGSCRAITRFGIPIRCWAEPGWRDAAPACGQQGRWFSECNEGMFSCDEGPAQLERQQCR